LRTPFTIKIRKFMNSKNIFFLLMITTTVSSLSAHSQSTVPVKRINWTPGKVAIVTSSTLLGAGAGFVLGVIASSNPRDAKDHGAIVLISTATIGALAGILSCKAVEAYENSTSSSDNTVTEKSTPSK
jgi:hypothetical protein